MNHVTYNLFRRWALLWVAVVFAVGRLTADDQNLRMHWYSDDTITTNTYTPTQFRAYVLTPPGYETPGEPIYFTGEQGKEGYSGWITMTVDDQMVWLQYFDPGFDFVGNSYVDTLAAGAWVDCGVGYLKDGSGSYRTVNFLVDSYLTKKKQATSDEMKTLWLVTDTTLTADLYREGTDKIVAGLKTLPAPGGGEGGGGTDMVNTEFMHTQQKGYYDAEGSGTSPVGDLRASPMASVVQAASESDTAKTAIEALLPAASTTVDLTAPTGGSADFLSIEMPAAFGGATVHFNPFADQPGMSGSSMADLASWFRYATQWLAYALLAIWIFGEFKEYMIGMSAVRQASGNPVAGGTGAQATSLVNAGLITAAVVVALTALLAFTFNSITIGGLLTNLTTNPLLGMAANVFWFLDQIFPLNVILACFVARGMFQVAGNTIFGTFFTVVRFFVA